MDRRAPSQPNALHFRATHAMPRTYGLGRLVFEYGATSLVSKVASARKSIPAMLFGNYAAQVGPETLLREP
jgi:hypothetical protein